MKQSKIIVPIIAMMMLSTAATVSGTVAWFTAQRTYNNTITSFGVDEIDGDMEIVDADNIIGTTVNNNTLAGDIEVALSDGATPTAHDSILADASWDYTSGILYTDNGSATSNVGFNESSFISLGTADGSANNEASKWKVSSSADNYMYYACAYYITFSYDFSKSDVPMNLFIDLSTSGSTFSHATGAAGTSATEIYTGLRIGLECTGLTYTESAWTTCRTVIAPFQGTASNVKCANGVNSVRSIPNGVLNNSSDGTFDLARAADGTTSIRSDYLGTFFEDPNTENSIHSDQLTVKVIIWLEGTDPNVISANTKSTFSASMKFYCAKAITSEFIS